MKVLFFTLGDETVASSRTRVFQYLPYLAQHDVSTEVICYHTGLDYRLLAKIPKSKIQAFAIRFVLKLISLFHYFYATVQIARLLIKARDVDIVFLQKVLLPIPIQTLLAKVNSRIVFDFDDALYADEIAYSKERFHVQLKRCKLAVLENEVTQAYIKQFHTPSIQITGPIECRRYSPEIRRPDSKTEFIIGWIGSRSTTAYLDLIKRPLREILVRHATVVLEVVGAGPLNWDGLRVRQFEWNLDYEVERLRRFDVGIMPLSNTDFAKGKGGYKLLQYMAMGIPSLASPVGINCEIMTDGETGFLCADAPQWIDALDKLIGNQGLRTKIGQAARERAEKKYSYEIATPRLIRALEVIQGDNQR